MPSRRLLAALSHPWPTGQPGMRGLTALFAPMAPQRDRPMPESPILIVPYMWIGDFVRSHSVVKLLRQRFPSRPVDLLTNTNTAPLLQFMPGVRKGVVADLPRGRLPIGEY